MDKYPLIIAGSRTVTDYDILIDAMSAFLIDPDHIAEVISGKEPNGVDRLGEQMAEAFGIPVVPFPADWSQGKKGGSVEQFQDGSLRGRAWREVARDPGPWRESRHGQHDSLGASLARVPTLIWYP
jgi:hypothetical protein